jgi:hypothetical protein
MIPTEEQRLTGLVILKRSEKAVIAKDDVEVWLHSDVATPQLAQACWNAARGRPGQAFSDSFVDGSNTWWLTYDEDEPVDVWLLWLQHQDQLTLTLTRENLFAIAEQLA